VAAAGVAAATAAGGPADIDRWEVETATDSDDEAAGGSTMSEGGSQEGLSGEDADLGDFMDAYSRAMQVRWAEVWGSISGRSGASERKGPGLLWLKCHGLAVLHR
jgi:hypothetical protein